MKRILRSLAAMLFFLSLCGQSVLAAGLALYAELLPDDALWQRYHLSIYQAISLLEEDMSDAEKALVLHDYVAANCVYDDALQDISRTPQGALGNGLAICTGYAEAYRCLLSKAGIPSVVVANGRHAWNVVQIDGEWYHVDVTWDDALATGRIGHTYFLISDDTIRDDGAHDVWSAKPAGSRTYETHRLRQVTSEMVYLDGWFYFTDTDGLWRYQLEQDRAELIRSFDWDNAEEQFSSLAARDGVLYYHSPDTVYALRPGRTPEAIYHTSGGKRLTGLYLNTNQTLIGLLQTSPDTPTVETTIRTFDPVMPADYHWLYADGTDYFGAQYVLDERRQALALLSGSELTGAYEIPARFTWMGRSYAVDTIYPSACYRNGRLTALRIPETMVHIEADAFCGCTRLAEVVCDSMTLEAVKEGTFGETAWLDNQSDGSIVYLGNIALMRKGTLSGDIVVREGTTILKSDLFRDQIDVTSIVLSEGVTALPIGFASGCENLRRVVLPDGIVTIGMGAFAGCSSLASLELPDSVREIGSYAFGLCNAMTSFHLPNALTFLDQELFPYCTSLMEIVIDDPDGRYYTRDGVLFDREQSMLHTYPAGKTDAHYRIPDGIIAIESGAFSSTQHLQTLDLNQARSFDFALQDCGSLTELTIPEGVTSSDLSLSGCDSLRTLSLPSTLESLRGRPWFFLPALERIEVAEGNPAYSSLDGVLYTQDQQTLLHYPRGKTDERLVIPEGVRIVEADAVQAPALRTLVLPDSLEEGWETFGHIPHLETIVVSDDNPHAVLSDGVLYDRNMTRLLLYPNGKPDCTLRLPEESRTMDLQLLCYESTLETLIIPAALASLTLPTEAPVSMREIAVAEDNPAFQCIDGVLYDKPVTCLLWFPTQNPMAELALPEGITSFDLASIGAARAIRALHLPASLAMFRSAYHPDSRLERITVAEENPQYTAIDGVLYDKMVSNMIAYPPYRPDATYTMPDSVTYAGCLEWCRFLEEVTLSGGVDVYILNCENLRTITVGEGTTVIERTIAMACPVQSLYIPASVRSITVNPVTYVAPSTVTIYGRTGSAAEACARNYGYTFVSTGLMTPLGDINGDQAVNTTDARLALQYAVEKITLDEEQLAAGDVDGNGIVNTTDARLILQKAVEKIDRFPAES